MKKAGWFFGVFLVLTVLAALFFKAAPYNRKFEKTEFLFDTTCTVTAYGKGAEAAVEAVFERLEEIHRETDMFSENSTVARFNFAKMGETIDANEDLTKILETAVEIGKHSNGAFDVTIAPVVQLWNFSGDGRVPSKSEIEEKLELVGLDKFVFEKSGRLGKNIDGVMLDLGGAAKGYAGDEAIEVLKNHGVSGAVVDLGGNITCFGDNPATSDGKWRIGLQKPFSPTGEFDDVVEIKSGAVVTGGTYQRYFEKNGKKYHHIIDPHTGYPSDKEYSSVTIVAENGLLADCLATACFVMGKEEGSALAEMFGAEAIYK
ncbi:MAG: FAD:protein FMN transferase [Clostridia bacterium]|nr:FAD:protein FMN transferase [Clostridia bacterium]